MTPSYGYSKIGEEVSCKTPGLYIKHSLLMAISNNKIVGWTLHKGSTNSTVFCDFLKTLDITNRTVILDNVSFHKSKIVRDFASDNKINLCYIPPYSPEYNPIEYAFSQIKHYYRKLMNITNVEDRVSSAIKYVEKIHCLNYFRKCIFDVYIKK